MRLSYPAPSAPWTTNEDRRLHFAVRAGRVKDWHDAAYWMLRKLQTEQQWDMVDTGRAKYPLVVAEPKPMTVHMTITFPTARKRDASNLIGTVVKATVDGLRDAGLWPDDDGQWVTILEPKILSPVDGWHQVQIDLEERQ